MFKLRASVPVVLSLIAGGLVASAVPAAASTIVQPNIVNAVPATNTPDFNNGIVYTIAQVGNTVYAGGSFTSASNHGSSTALTTNYIAAFSATTGQLIPSFAPTLNNAVQSIIPGPAANEIYAAGNFNTADGVTTHIALLNATDGSMISTWKPSGQNGVVQKLALADNMLFAGGSFTAVGNTPHGALVALDPNTGKVLPYVNLSFTGHHNYGVNCAAGSSGCASGTVGIKDLDVDASGTHLVAIGNFTSVSGSARDQVALIDLGGSSATVDQNFKTLAYTAACFDGAFDSYVRGVNFSPDGSYFVIAGTGGSGTNKDGTNSSCDTAARFETNAVGSNVRPTWIDYTGQDTFLSVAITGGVVYVGGHQRWVNNSKGYDSPGPGAVPRPGLVALNPISGMPFTWNPGRNPRGAGTYVIYPTSTGIYIGSDTDYIGNHTYLHKKLAFFPLAGGEAFPADATPSLPGRVYTVGGFSPTPVDRFSYRHFDGTTVGAEQTQSTGVAWGSTRGAFMVNGELIYGKGDGNLYERTFDGSTLGSEVLIDPYDDPYWQNVDTGSGQTFKGKRSDLAAELPNVSSMFFTNGRLYYTLTGSASMHWRWFEPESGVVGSDEFTVSDGDNWSNVAGAFVSGNTLYYANRTSGALSSIGWNGTQATGSPTVVNTTQNWASRSMFVLADATNPNQPPVADFTATCSATTTACTLDASASHDPDGSISDYAWTYDGGAVDHHVNAAAFSHDFGSVGHHSVSLTVTDNDGATDTKTTQIVVGQVTPVPTFVGANSSCASMTSTCAKGNEADVTVPAGAAVGDAMLLFVTQTKNGTVTSSVPSGWNLLDTNVASPMETKVYYRAVKAGDVGSNVAVTFSGSTRRAVTIADYSGADPNTIEAYAKASDANTTSHTTPNATVSTDGSLAVSYWADKSSTTTAWTVPGSVTLRSSLYDTGTAYDTAVLADSGSTVASGSYGGKTATTNAASGKATEVTIILAPAGTTTATPQAAFTSNCTNLSCTFDASGSSESGGSIATYAWDFGDGNTQPASTSVTATHTYTGPGTDQVTLTVTDANHVSDSVTQPVAPTAPGQNISFIGANAADAPGTVTSTSVTVPAGVTAGDSLLLFESHNSTSVTTTTPAGWTKIGGTTTSNLTSSVYEKTAVAGDAGSTVSVGLSAAAKQQVTVAAYHNVSTVSPIETSATSTATSTATHTTPALSGLTAGTWVVNLWADKSTVTSTWTPPATVTKRSDIYGTGGGATSALITDSATSITGNYPTQTATTNATSGSAAQWSIALTPSS